MCPLAFSATARCSGSPARPKDIEVKVEENESTLFTEWSLKVSCRATRMPRPHAHSVLCCRWSTPGRASSEVACGVGSVLPASWRFRA